MRIDVWSDIVCPYCHLGRRHLDLALEQFEHAEDVDVYWHSYELDRGAPAVGTASNIDRIAAKYGLPRAEVVAQHEDMAQAAAAVGLDFRWDTVVPSNSYAAHRLLHYARSVGRQREVTDRVMTAWYTEGAAIGDHQVLLRLASDAGLDADATTAILDSDEFGMQVRTDEALAKELGINAVPTFVLDQKYAVQGAHPVETFVQALRQVWDDRSTAPTPREASGCRGDGACGCGRSADGTCDGSHEHADDGSSCSAEVCAAP